MRRGPAVATATWCVALLSVGAIHFEFNRGGLAQLFAGSGARSRLTVGHLPVT